MKKKLPIILLGVILACVLVFGFLYANNDIGKTANSLEADIRQSQKILDDWIVDGSISDTMAAFISYPQDKTDHTFSVYVNRPGLSFGYFFRGGGDIFEFGNSFFGFTESEVKAMLSYYGVSDKEEELKDWYDGYLFGSEEIYNPWSVINYISDNCFPKAFWQSTGSNEIIGEIIQAATPEITKDLYKLLCGEKIAAYIDTGVIYPEVQNNPYSIYSFLLVAGYLKVANIYPQSDGNFMCDVAIPNKEITFVYEKEVLNRTNQNSLAISISQAIFSKDTQKLQALLEDFMVKSISSIDGANEGFYHGMMLGLCAILGNRYKIRSNRESGLGRFDIQLMPLTKGMPGFIFEFKHTKDEHTDLSALADSALQQIEAKKYDTELRDNGVNSIISIGIAFRGKSAVVRRG